MREISREEAYEVRWVVCEEPRVASAERLCKAFDYLVFGCYGADLVFTELMKDAERHASIFINDDPKRRFKRVHQAIWTMAKRGVTQQTYDHAVAMLKEF